MQRYRNVTGNMSQGRFVSSAFGFRVLMMAFPREFRERHGRDLLELYRDYSVAGRPASRIGAAWDLLRNGFGTRVDDLRPAGARRKQQLPRKRNTGMDSIWQDVKFGARTLRKSPAFVDRFFPDETPIGQRLGLGQEGDPSEYEIVGVAANVKYQRLADQQYPVAHVALAQHAEALRSMTVAVRTGGDTSAAISAARW